MKWGSGKPGPFFVDRLGKRVDDYLHDDERTADPPTGSVSHSDLRRGSSEAWHPGNEPVIAKPTTRRDALTNAIDAAERGHTSGTPSSARAYAMVSQAWAAIAALMPDETVRKQLENQTDRLVRAVAAQAIMKAADREIMMHQTQVERLTKVALQFEQDPVTFAWTITTCDNVR